MQLTEEAFNQWKESPVTEYVLKHLLDVVKDKAESMVDIISHGGTLDHDEQLVNATICATLRETAEIDFEVIEDFNNRDKE